MPNCTTSSAASYVALRAMKDRSQSPNRHGSTLHLRFGSIGATKSAAHLNPKMANLFLADPLICPLLTSVTRWACLAVRSVQHGTRNGPPGVNPATFDARLSDIPNTAKQRIEDFVVCCRLVPTVSSLIRLLFVSPHLCLRLLSGWRYRFPLALG